jgi:hypothetical protein
MQDSENTANNFLATKCTKITIQDLDRIYLRLAPFLFDRLGDGRLAINTLDNAQGLLSRILQGSACQPAATV